MKTILKIFKQRENGFTLVEVLVGLMILAIVGTAGLVALTGATKARFQADVRTTAVSLADTILESVKGNSTEYIFADVNSNYIADYSVVLDSISKPSNYQIHTLDNTGASFNGKIYGLPWNIKPSPTSDYNKPVYNLSNKTDPGIQKVTIIVLFENKEIFRLVDFKVHR
jgi:prepilin-type N-terminal cleavage/methylation domain-containing protein